MSRYGLNSLLYRVRTDLIYRQRFLADRNSVISEWEISPQERAAVNSWDVRQLNHLGVYLHIVIGLSNILKNPQGVQDFQYDAENLSPEKALDS